MTRINPVKSALIALLMVIGAGFPIATGAQSSVLQPEERVPHIVYDRSDQDVPLNITFDGTEILIYGAVENQSDLDPDLIIKITGPRKDYKVFKKEREIGMWINGPEMTFRNVPSFMAIFSDAPIDTIMLPTEKQRYRIGFDQTVPLRGIADDVSDPAAFQKAFISLQQRKRNYVLDQDGVKVSGDVLFSAKIPLAADIIEGNYIVDIYLLDRGKVIASVSSDLPVYKAGVERWLFDLSQENGLLYGLLAILIAITAALFMNQVMRLLKR